MTKAFDVIMENFEIYGLLHETIYNRNKALTAEDMLAITDEEKEKLTAKTLELDNRRKQMDAEVVEAQKVNDLKK